jgi:hypothetical protein
MRPQEERDQALSGMVAQRRVEGAEGSGRGRRSGLECEQ